ncbi:GAS domain-containing protein [Trichonephila inaurata madagascariensis]|uniref:GAS domain-containing protein n=1 Tax=Trichonephila inaurata madagascariensis TaxID=2747483 RepID=A0A8X6YR54_9ARAC|nr:GAS domain-containing protein [Trichonephila inaurata madagascariensis]
MPPMQKMGKNKMKDEKIEGYDVRVMNISEMREYARMLERDIETMRCYKNLYQMIGDHLGEAYKLRQEGMKRKQEEILAKDVEMQLKGKECAKEELFTERPASEMTFRQEEGFSRERDKQNQVTGRIMRTLKLEAEDKAIEIERKAAMEKNKLRNMDGKKHFLENTIEPFVEIMEEGQQLTRLVSETIQDEALESSRKEFRDVCTSYKEKLHEYYKELIRQDVEDIRNAKYKAENLEAAFKSTQSLLKETQQKALLKVNTYKPYQSEANSITELKLQKVAEIDRLKKENAMLLEQIQNVEKEIVQLRKAMTPVLYKIRQSADMKTAILKKKFKSFSDTRPATDENSLLYRSYDSNKQSSVGNMEENTRQKEPSSKL